MNPKITVIIEDDEEPDTSQYVAYQLEQFLEAAKAKERKPQ